MPPRRTRSPIRPMVRARTTSLSLLSASSVQKPNQRQPAAPPFGLRELREGKIRILARGSDVPSLRGQTVRTLIVNADSLKTKRDAIMRFMEAYREAVDWMYSDPKALEMYSKKMNQPVDLLKESMDKFQPKETMQTDKFADLDGAIRDAVQLKFLDKPLTQDQIAELLQIPPRKK